MPAAWTRRTADEARTGGSCGLRQDSPYPQAPMEPSPTVPSIAAPEWPDAAPPLPAAVPLFGRDPLVRQLIDDLRSGDDRAVVLAGLGGVGKTRLAAELARALGVELGGRVGWIPLARASREGGLVTALAAGLGLPDVGRDRLPEAV